MNRKAAASTENIQVFLRMRPPNRKEVEGDETDIWTIGKNYVKLNPDKFASLARAHRIHSAPYTKTCFFNGCFDQVFTNPNIYVSTVKPIVEGSLNGINGTLFLYGQTGAGKTYTMMGDYSEEIARANAVAAGGCNTSRGNRTPIRGTSRPAAGNTSRMIERSRTPIGSIKGGAAAKDPGKAANTTGTLKNEGVLVLSLKDLFGQISKVLVFRCGIPWIDK